MAIKEKMAQLIQNLHKLQKLRLSCLLACL